MEVFIQNKAVETIERSRVINLVETLIDQRNERKIGYSGMPEQDVALVNLDIFLKIVKDKFPLEYQIAIDKYRLENSKAGKKF